MFTLSTSLPESYHSCPFNAVGLLKNALLSGDELAAKFSSERRKPAAISSPYVVAFCPISGTE